MQLDRTVIIPADDPTLASKLLCSLIYDEDCIVAVVFGDTGESRDAVVKADRRAGVVQAGFGRKVAWVRDSASVKKVTDGLLPKTDLQTALAISISLDNTIADTIRKGEQVDFLRIEQLFTRAGMKQ